MRKEESVAIKKSLLRLLCEKMEKTLQTAQTELETTKQSAIDSPGRMESRYDSAKEELSSLANSMQNRVAQLQQNIARLRNFRISDLPQEEAEIGTLVEMTHKIEKKFYFILPAGGGETIESPDLDAKVTVITPSSPLSNSLRGKKIGASIRVGPRELTLVALS